jgi:hypothetical protein
LKRSSDDIPRLINLRFAHVRDQLDALDARVSTVEAKVDNMRVELHTVKTELQALPRVLAELLDERDKRNG